MPTGDPQILAVRLPRALCAANPADLLLEQLHGVAVRTLAHLGPQQRRELWIEPRWLGCPLERAAPAVRERFAVYRAIAGRDAGAMLERARALLEGGPVRGAGWARFLLDTAMLGAQASGQGKEATRLWARHARALLGGRMLPYERYVAEWRN